MSSGVPCEVCRRPTEAWRLAGGGVLWRCPGCRHVHRDPTDCPAWARDEAYGGDPGLDAVRLALTHRRLARLVPPGGSVFEIGYGSGALLRRFLDAGLAVAGVDRGQLGVPVDPAVAAAGRLLTGDLEQVAIGVARNDLVYGVHVVEHLADPREGLRRARALLRPGGRLCLVTPTADSAGPALFGDAWWLLEDPTHLRFFSPRSAHLLLAQLGFSDVAVRRLRLDTLSMEAASLRRRLAPRRRRAGVLAERSTLLLAAATAPVAVAARIVAARLAPSIEVLARRPAGGG